MPVWHQNVKGRILLIGVEFAHMCASILFRPDNGTWPDLRIEAKDISVNGQKYTDRTAIALQERESMLELPINLKHIDRRGNCYEDFWNIEGKTARAFFEHRGYSVIQKQKVIRSGISLTNYIMEKWTDFSLRSLWGLSPRHVNLNCLAS